ncbi:MULTISPECIES: hypothetical protein [Xanthomonas]|uniref:Uncharacterized protein n=1 Tax=Xanthomonas arboricola TaxID=56448 RepID=A0AB73H017_9XANT|nr:MULTISPECIES: hypothetical protein [Xanthomonas]MBB4768080.1 hypothetical protein [Xanthomonas arboricola]MBB5671699.1 hypothetical protein [Xanthomonas arboricola]NJC28838.1 hypothetical protein [Xanthomonas arboricola]
MKQLERRNVACPGSLDAGQVRGSHDAPSPIAESPDAGSLTFTQNIYAVFLIAQ